MTLSDGESDKSWSDARIDPPALPTTTTSPHDLLALLRCCAAVCEALLGSRTLGVGGARSGGLRDGGWFVCAAERSGSRVGMPFLRRTEQTKQQHQQTPRSLRVCVSVRCWWWLSLSRCL